MHFSTCVEKKTPIVIVALWRTVARGKNSRCSTPRHRARGRAATKFSENKNSLYKKSFFPENPAQSNASLCACAYLPARIESLRQGASLLARVSGASPLPLSALHKAFFPHVFCRRVPDRSAPIEHFFQFFQTAAPQIDNSYVV